MSTFHLVIVAPSRKMLEFEAVSITVPGEAGYIGVREGREPVLVSLKVGVIHVITSDGTALYFGVTGGFFEMIENEATVLADALILEDAASMAEHLKGRKLTIPAEFASEVQKIDLASALLRRKTDQVEH
ncbi:MAG TPA: hypothetical protein PKM25_02390 [Candidatus Ozemobacteraceae bacterium]|nr:hypothetical protein [Candidatus Ozemobacteraceae bacterium]